jgi:hypothetical protein
MFNTKLSIDQVNYLNIGLMVISAVTALIWPFETFLFVYAFLGPLHYLTEISWLHDKKYFTSGKYDYLFLIGAGVVITIMYFNWITGLPPETGSFVTYLAFAAALFFVIFKKTSSRLIAMFIAILFSNFIVHTGFFEAIFGVFLPTLIHVFIFTALFILVGALRGRSFSGISSLVIFVIVSVGLLSYHPAHYGYHVSDYVKSSYGYLKNDGSFTDGFISLNHYIFSAFKLHDFGKPTVPFTQYVQGVNDYLYHNSLALSIMSFIGFAYMYHYLNWFSKTSVIQWHNIPKSRFIAVIILWVASLALYAYDYAVGLEWLFFLSFTHVLLEFPLNHITFINIGKEIGGIVTGKKKAGKPATSKA